MPRDRAATFEPQIVKKRQRRLSGVDEVVLSLYAKGLTTGEIGEVPPKSGQGLCGLSSPRCVIVRSDGAEHSDRGVSLLSVVEMHPPVHGCNEFRCSSEGVVVVVLVFERRPQRFGADVVPADPGGTHRSTRAGISARGGHRRRGVLGEFHGRNA